MQKAIFSFSLLAKSIFTYPQRAYLGLPAIGRGTYPIPFRTRQLNHAPFPVVVWSSAMPSWESWLPHPMLALLKITKPFNSNNAAFKHHKHDVEGKYLRFITKNAQLT
jgi:hypothetical protein